METICIGVDVGNFDTKTKLTTTPSGFEIYKTKPFGADCCLEYDGKFYVPDSQRFKYAEDKTVNDRAFILTLMGIAKEIIATGKVSGAEDMQKYISDIKTVHLGVGLPPAHMPLYKDKLTQYYDDRFWGGITFIFDGYEFSFTPGICDVFPQGYAAIKARERTTGQPLFGGIPDYYLIDIGGYTMDVVPVVGSRPQGNKCKTYERGILLLYDEIISGVKRTSGKTIDMNNIESFLSGRPTMLSGEIQEYIERESKDWTGEAINELRQSGILFDSYPAAFTGGGPLRLKKYIDSNSVLSMHDYIPSPNANAEGFEFMIQAVAKARGLGV